MSRRLAYASAAILVGLVLMGLLLAACDGGSEQQAQWVYSKWHTFHSDAILTATGNTLSVEGLAVVGVQVEGIVTATAGCEGSIDGSTYYGLYWTSLTTGLTSTTTITDGLFVVAVSGVSLLRCPVTVYVSGTIDVIGDGTALGR
jgi:hypothetical protein